MLELIIFNISPLNYMFWAILIDVHNIIIRLNGERAVNTTEHLAFFGLLYGLYGKGNIHIMCISLLRPCESQLYMNESSKHGVQRRMISVDNFFVFLRLLFFALLMLYVT